MIPLKVTEFDALPPNFEVWPNAGLPGTLAVPGAQGKPTLQEFFWALEEIQAGIMPPNPIDTDRKKRWYQLLDLYAQVTMYVDQQIGDVLKLLEQTGGGGRHDHRLHGRSRRIRRLTWAA